MLVDSHCHLDFPRLASVLPDVLENARKADVLTCLTISTSLSTFKQARSLIEPYKQVWISTGVHPHNASEEGPATSEPLIRNAQDPRCIAIGEAGLDYYYEKSLKEDQKASFRVHIEASQKTGLPLIVHTRDADEDTISILKEHYQEKPFDCVIHCYSSSHWLGEQALSMGFYLGIGGILTFKRSTELRDSVKGFPKERIILETDSPYLAPVPNRGKTNEPAYTACVAGVLAELWNLSADETARITTDNFFELFSKADRPAR